MHIGLSTFFSQQFIMEGLISKTLIFCTMSLLSWKTSQALLPPSSCDVLQSLSGKNKLSIPESSYTASSFFGYRYPPFEAKLNGSHGWAARDNDNPNDYLQIDLGTPRVIVAVATQGNGGSSTDPDDRPQEWVTKYVISYRNSDKWIKYKENRKMKVFKGNTDTKSVVRHFLKNPAKARYIKFVPVEYHSWKTMRVDVYFNNQEPPRITSVVPRERSIELSWTYKPCGPTRHIAGYVVRLENKTGTYEVTSNRTVCSVTNLKPYTEYNVSVRAIQQVGYGVWTNTTTTTTTIAEPESIPVITNITSGSSQSILIQWKVPDRDKINGPLQGYRITYTPQGGNTKTIDVTGDVTTYTLMSLLKYTTYSISVAVMNTKYIGPPSTRLSVRTLQDGRPLVISPLTNKTITKGDPIYLVCNASGDPTPNITWSKAGGAINPLHVSGNVLKIPRAELSDAGQYVCTARNGFGGKIFVKRVEVFVTVKLRPHSPVPLSTQITHVTIKIHWKAPESHGFPVLMYSIHKVELDDAGQEVTSRSYHVNEDVHDYEVGDVEGGKSYKFYVTAWNTHGESVKDRSKSISVKLQKP